MKTPADHNLPMNNDLLFVYGTLKRGEGNYRVLEQADAEFVAEAKTVERFPMTGQYVPFLHMEPGVGHHVKGEIHAVKSFTRLDQFEGAYTRKPVLVETKDKTQCWVWAYFTRRARHEDEEMMEEFSGRND